MSIAKKGRTGELCPGFGKKRSEDTKRRISASRIGRFCGERNPFFGKHHSEEVKQRQSERRKAQIQRDGVPFAGRKHSQESVEKMRARALHRNAEPGYRAMISERTKQAMVGDALARLRLKAKQRGQDPAWREAKSLAERNRWKTDKAFAEKMRTSRNAKPNKSEHRLQSILDALYPGEWRFTGDYSFIVNGKNPDFVNCNGKKLIIELFGEPWHRGETEESRAAHFAPFGYRTLVIWWKELQNRELTISKIREFVNHARV